MKAKIIIILLSLIVASCHDDSSKQIEDCLDPIDLKVIYSEYYTIGKPLAEIDFEKRLKPEWVKADFYLLRQILEEANPNIYRYADKSHTDSLFNSISCQLNDSVSYRDFTKHIARVFNNMACGHSGWAHSDQYRAYRNELMKFFPFEILSVNDQYFIVKNNSTDTSIKDGMEILSLNGSKSGTINQTLRKFMYRDGESIPQAETEISKYFPNAYSNFIGDVDTFSIHLRNSVGKTLHLKVPALPRAIIDSISKTRYERDKEMGKPLLLEIDTAINVANYTIKWFRNEYIQKHGQNFNAFTDSVFQVLQSNEIENLIIDLRGNVGGWTANGKKLFSYFIEQPIPYINKVEFAQVDSFSFKQLILSDQGISDTMAFTKNEAGLFEWTNYPNLIAYPT